MQEKFRSAIWKFDLMYGHLNRLLYPERAPSTQRTSSQLCVKQLLTKTTSLRTTQKVLRAAKILDVPIIVTTQNGTKLGPTVSELQELTADAVVNADKTAFSMLRVPEIAARFPRADPTGAAGPLPSEVAIVGIETHICVTQTALDLLERGHKVYVLADGVSSCNEMDARVAFARLRAAGAVITTSESWLYECMGDAGIPPFRDVAKLVKETGPGMKEVLKGLISNL
ncbi:hypothetical protein PC116_g29774 [Phytophthora cactorum]|nr:hypothetical protein PC116_g29774 [Phytophthora cactorum]